MKDFTLSVLGNDYTNTTKFIEKIINSTKAKTDQEHMKMNIIINNKLLEKKENELLEIIKTFENFNSSLICLCFNDENIYKFIKNNTNIKVINNEFKLNDDLLINNILNLFYQQEDL